MGVPINYIEQNLLNFRMPLKLKIPNLSSALFKLLEKRSLKALDKTYYVSKGFLGDINEDQYPIPREDYKKFKKILLTSRELNEFFDKVDSPKLFKMKVMLIEIEKTLEEIESHLVDASTLSETDFLTINKSNKKELDRAIKSNDYVEYSIDDF